jgi:hypothetical protein
MEICIHCVPDAAAAIKLFSLACQDLCRQCFPARAKKTFYEPF